MVNIPPRYIDISLSFRANPVTGDIITVVDEAAVRQSIENLVMTMNYETPFHSEIGSNVTNSLFDNISPLTAIVIQKSIQSVINNFEPRVNLLGVNVVVSPDTNGYTATIVYRLINRTDPTTITLFLQKTR